MSTQGHRPFRQFFLSSVVAKVLRDSSCPVWTGVHLADVAVNDFAVFQKIGCAIDLGLHTESALRWASQFASAFGALLLVIHVTKPTTGTKLDSAAHVELVRQAREEIAYLLSSLGINAEIAVGSGSVPQVVYDLALGFAADILVIGRYAEPHRLHSDTYTIIRRSHCPVVSV